VLLFNHLRLKFASPLLKQSINTALDWNFMGVSWCNQVKKITNFIQFLAGLCYFELTWKCSSKALIV